MSLDTDGDTIPDCVDTDDDNDGVIDTADAFPLDPAEWTDTDSDGIGNNADLDDDNDGQSDYNELVCGSDPYWRVPSSYQVLSLCLLQVVCCYCGFVAIWGASITTTASSIVMLKGISSGGSVSYEHYKLPHGILRGY